MGRWLAAAGVWMAVLAPAAGAATWRDLAVPKTSKIYGLTASPSVPGLAWATVSGPHLMVTRDAGVSWAPFGLTDGLVTIPVEDAVPSRWWRTSDRQLQRSDDGGATWQTVPGLAEALDTVNVGIYYAGVQQLLADPARTGVLYAIAVTGITNDNAQTVFASPDGGVTWSHWPYLRDHYSRGDRGFVATWNALAGRDALLLVRAGALVTDVTQEVSIVDKTGITRLQYGTGTRGPGNEASGTMVGLTYTGRAALDTGGTRVLLETKRGWQLSTDTGAHFHLLQPVIAARRVPPVFDPAHPGRIYAVRDGKLVRSDDDGRSWLQLATGLRSAQAVSVDAGGLVYVYGPSGFSVSRDEGHTFAYIGALGAPLTIGSLHDDGHGGLLASTERGVWRIGPDEQWSPLDRGIFPLPAALATPLGTTAGVLVLRSRVSSVGESSLGPGPRLEVLTKDGAVRPVPLPAKYAGRSGPAFFSDAQARRIVLGADWTTTGGRRWHVAPARETSVALSASPVVYGTRDDRTKANRGSLWRRAGAQPWKQVSRYAGIGCRPVAAGSRHVYLYCADRLLRSDDAGRTLRVVAVPDSMRNVLSMAADTRRPDHIALLFTSYPSVCGGEVQSSTLTSVDGGAAWQRVADPCHGPRYEKLAIAPNHKLVRWSNYDPSVTFQVLDDWP